MSGLTAGRLADEERDGRFARATIWATCLACLGFVGWAWITPVHEVVSGAGLLVPEGRLVRIEHLYGGRVAELSVREGDVVEAGAELIRLGRGELEAEGRATAARIALLDAEIARHAVLADLDLSSGAGAAAAPEGTDPALLREIAFRQAQIEGVAAQRRIDEAERAALAGQRGTLTAELALLRARAERYRGAQQGVLSGREIGDLDREVLGLERALARIDGEAQIVAAGIARHDATEAEIVASWRREAALRLEERREQRVAAAETLARIEDRLGRTRVTAPRAGTVTTLAVRGPGEVVAPGELIAEIVPRGARLMAEIEIPADRIADIATGQAAAVKVLTYDFTRFGEVAASVARISASSYEDADGRSVYGLVLALEDGADARLALSPGMTVTADIRSGDRTVLEFLLRPARLLADRSFVEP